MTRKVGCAILVAVAFTSLVAQATIAAPTGTSSSIDAERNEIDAFTARFLKAFENLDLPAFMSCFADEATVFFPVPEPPERFAGKPAIQQRFQQVFDAIRVGAASGPPYHHLAPENTQVQILAPAEALVTFELKSAERIGRRTLVLKKSHGQWLIVHLHASNVPLGSVRAAGE
jgi:ketosteroid isomerase-like protein